MDPAGRGARTSRGLEADLVIERERETLLVEVKAGSGRDPAAAAALRTAMTDVGAARGYLVSHAPGVEPLAERVERRGFASSIDWLPA